MHILHTKHAVTCSKNCKFLTEENNVFYLVFMQNMHEILERLHRSNDANVSNSDSASCRDSCHCGQDSEMDMCSLKNAATVQTAKSIQHFVIYLYLTT